MAGFNTVRGRARAATRRGRAPARPTKRALALAASPRGQATALRMGRGAMVSRTIGRYGRGSMGKAKSVTEGTFRKMFKRKKRLEGY